MRISKETDYALRITLYLSTKEEDEITSAKEIADIMGIPERFNLKILRSLCMGNVTKSYRGIYGGYTLDRSPAEISMMDVIRAIDGEMELARCINRDDDCSAGLKEDCPMQDRLMAASQVLAEEFEKYNFEDAKADITEGTFS